MVARATAQLSFQRHQQLSGGIGTGRTGREPQFHIAEGGIGSHCWVGRRQQIGNALSQIGFTNAAEAELTAHEHTGSSTIGL